MHQCVQSQRGVNLQQLSEALQVFSVDTIIEVLDTIEFELEPDFTGDFIPEHAAVLRTLLLSMSCMVSLRDLQNLVRST